MKKFIFFLLLIFNTLGCYGPVVGNDSVYDLRKERVVNFNDMIDDIFKSEIIVVGELHDVMEHHRFQLRVIRAIFEREKNIAIAMEMFRAEAQPELDRWVKQQMSEDEFKKVFKDNWRTGWELYSEILFFARDNKIPIIGLNVPSEITRKVAQRGFASLTREELKRLPEGVTCEISETYMNFIKKTHQFHGGAREFVHFCEAQMLWDKAMALNTINYMKKNNIKKVVLITGKGHAWKHAIPEQIKSLSNYKVSVLIPNLSDDKDQPTSTIEDADYLF
ncbi:MAG: ChaN family lipoprotein [Proteobacteria bacterium]|nr:ChaN family lipoprotein [Pseudomonadota bacterium]